MEPGSKEVGLLYGRAGMKLTVPSRTDVLRGTGPRPLANPEQAVREALGAPIGALPLARIIAAKRPGRVAITVSDITRPVPYRCVLPPLLQELHDAGLPEAAITLIVGTGMHRPSTREEKAEILGEQIPGRYEVIDHRADDPVTLTVVSRHPTVRVCRRFVEADMRIVTGLIEPHFMAGFSGGRKGVCPALVDLETVQRFHGYETLSNPRADNGVLDGNPCHDIALSIARTVGVDFLVNVSIDRQHRLAGVYAGDLEAAHAAGCLQVRAATEVCFEAPYDLVITNGGGYPLDQTLYQTVKGMCTALPALASGSTLLQVSACGEGIGSAAYRDLLLRHGRNWRGFLRDLARHKDRTLLDQWEFQMQCRVLDRIGIEGLCLLTDGIPEGLLTQLALTPVSGDGSPAERAQHVIDRFVEQRPNARVALIPEGPYTLLSR